MVARLAFACLIAGAACGADLAPPLAEWKPGNEKAAFSKRVADRQALGVRGTGEDSVAWRTADLKLTPGGTYMFRFKTQAQGAGELAQPAGTIISGLENVNRDFAASAEWTTHSFAFRVPDGAAPTVLHLGHWNLKGEALFDGAELFPVQAVHTRSGDLELGAGERIDGAVYTDNHQLGWQGSTIHRTLFKQAAHFNSNRWCFGPGSEVVYKHALPFELNSGEVRLNVSYHTAGTLLVSVSKDGRNWVQVASAPKTGTIEAKLPAAMFPSKEILIRMQADGQNANLQVDSYTFRAQLEKAEWELNGKTILLEEREIAKGLRVRAEPTRNGNLLLRWANLVADSREFQLYAGFTTQAPWERFPHPLKIPPNGEAVCLVEFGFEEGWEDAGARFRLPPPTGLHTLTITASENMTRVCEWAAEVTCTVINESDFGHCVTEIPGVDAWWCEGAWKVGAHCFPHFSVAELANARAVIRISAARGEYEPAQLVLYSAAGGSLNKAEVSELKGPNGSIPASAISLYEVATVKVENPSDYLGEPGEYPDPLPPLALPLKLPEGRNQAIWILLHVPDDTPAGDYKGTISLTTNVGAGKVPLSVHVYDFALPKESHLRSGFGLDTGLIKRYHQLKTKEQELEVYDLYMRSFAQHRTAPYSFYEPAPIQVKFAGQGAARQVTLGWEAFDAAAQKYLDGLGFNVFMLQIQGLGGGTFFQREAGNFGGFKAGTPDYERLLGDYLKQIEAHLREKGWLNKAYVYWFDEPDKKDYPFVIEVMDRIKRLAPGLRRLLTKHPDGALPGHVDLWCGLTPEWTPQKVAERRAAGEEVWWYICCGPKAPYIGEFVEHPAVELRLWPWQSWQYGVQGILVWQTNYWTSPTAFPKTLQDPWQDAMSYVCGYGTPEGAKQFWGNGDGRFFYPPRRDPNKAAEPAVQPPVSSLRWENLRDGMEDYEYFVLLKEAIEKARGKADAALLQEATGLLTVPESISKNTQSFTFDVRPLLQHRDKVARMIERLAKSENKK